MVCSQDEIEVPTLLNHWTMRTYRIIVGIGAITYALGLLLTKMPDGLAILTSVLTTLLVLVGYLCLSMDPFRDNSNRENIQELRSDIDKLSKKEIEEKWVVRHKVQNNP